MKTPPPAFAMTSDVDWASEACLRAFHSILAGHGAGVTYFLTHSSPFLAALEAEGTHVELGLHPNFLPGSSHGSSVEAVVDHCLALRPGARGYRSHRYFDLSTMNRLFVARGMEYDSNVCCHLQAGLFPLKHLSGIPRYPVFWQDYVHYHMETSWEFAPFREVFFSPGIKVLNFHPLNVAFNVPSLAFYQDLKARLGDRWQRLTEEDIARHRHEGEGTETFLRRILEALSRSGVAVRTLGELHDEHARS